MGIMNLNREIPRFGKLKKDYIKVSMRSAKQMKVYIDNNKLPSCVEILKNACKGIGIADGHTYAASCVVEKDKKDLFLKRCEEFIEKGKK
jgi:hypothetical protein